MDDLTIKRAESILYPWVGQGNRFSVEGLSLHSSTGGLAIPLRSTLNQNLSSILRLRPPRPTPPPPSSHRLARRHRGLPASMRSAAHVARAAVMFEKLTGSAPPADAPQKALYLPLARLNPKPRQRLIERLRKRHLDALIASGHSDAKAEAKRRATKEADAVLQHSPRTSTLPKRLQGHAFFLLHNAIPTLDRDKNLPHNRGSNLLCQLCASQLETIEHLHTTCPCINKILPIVTGFTRLGGSQFNFTRNRLNTRSRSLSKE